VRVVRALAAGEEAFFAELERARGWHADGFAGFLRYHKLLDWVAPALADARAARFVPPALLGELPAYTAMRREHNAFLLRESVELSAGFAQAGLPCLFLKGLYFGDRFYRDPNRRHQSDIDVLVRSRDLEAALAVLGRSGFDVATNADDGKPVADALARIRGRTPSKAPHALTVKRGAARLDLHWCLSSRSLGRIDEAELWSARRAYRLAGHPFETLGDEHALTFLLVSICEDLRRGACRAKHFLDLYRMLPALEPPLSADPFAERLRRQGLLDPCVNVLAVFAAVWECEAELPEVASLLRGERRRIELRGAEEALALLERPRGSRENRAWFRRVYPRSRPRQWAWRLTRDLPHTLARLVG
jgi:hypothetical protein